MDIKKLYTDEEKYNIEQFLNKLSDIESKLNKIYSAITSLRKDGKDALIAEFMYRTVRSKIPYLKQSVNETELESIQKEIFNIEQEIDEIWAQEIIDVKKEIDDRLKAEGVEFIGRDDDDD